MPYPIRLPESRLKNIHPSVEAAFEARDYLWVCRYGRDNPELLGCALLFLGNIVGAERILGSIDTATTRLYRKWFSTDEHHDNYRIVIYNDDKQHPFREYLKNIPGIEVIPAAYNTSPDTYDVDLVMADFETYPNRLDEMDDVWINDFDAPVAFCPGDFEWRVDQLHKIMGRVDLIYCGSSSEPWELSQYGKHTVTVCPFPKRHGFKSKGLSERFLAERPLDLLFTGGIIQDFYRDKIERVLPLAYTLDERYKVGLIDGHTLEDKYQELLGMTKFTPIGTRYSGYWSGRNVEAIQSGVINLVSEESCMPFVFGEMFRCFCVVSNDDYCSQTEDWLGHYPFLMKEIIPHLPQLEAEMCSMFPDDEKTYWRRYLRRLLFVTQRDKEKYGPHSRPYAKLTAGYWLRKAMLEDPKYIEKGLEQFPNSLPLHYAKGILLYNGGRIPDAESEFKSIVDNNYVVEKDDPFPWIWDTLHGCFWPMDARVREQNDVEQLVPEINVWRSFTLGYLAYIGMQYVIDGTRDLRDVSALAAQATNLFKYNDTAKSLYLRTVYGMGYRPEFMRYYDIAQSMDGRIMHEFSAMAYDISKDETIRKRLQLFLSRVQIPRNNLSCYVEVLPLLEKYNLPHGGLQ